MKSKLLYVGIGLMVLGVVCVFYVSSMVAGPPVMIVFLAGSVCFLAGFVKFRRKVAHHIESVRSARRDQVVRKTFADLDMLRAKKRWRGVESEIVKTISVSWNDTTTVRYRYLCLTKRGAWFVYELEINALGKCVYRESLDPVDSDFAKDALLDDRELSAKYFNIPDIEIA